MDNFDDGCCHSRHGFFGESKPMLPNRFPRGNQSCNASGAAGENFKQAAHWEVLPAVFSQWSLQRHKKKQPRDAIYNCLYLKPSTF